MKRLQRIIVALAMMLLPLAASAQATLAIKDFDIKAGEEKEMVVDLNNPDDEITLVQFDLRLPAGLSVKKVGDEYAFDICDRTTWRKHSLVANETDGVVRFLLASRNNAVISGTSGAVIKMTLTADGSFKEGVIRLENILLVSPDEKESKPSDVEFTIGSSSTESNWKDGDEFTAKTIEGIDMKFKVLSAKDKTCQVGWCTYIDHDGFWPWVAIDPETVGTVTIPAEVNGLNVVRVGNGAFWECNKVTDIVVPQGITAIGTAAMSVSSVAAISLPESLTSLEQQAFLGCTSLKSVIIPRNATELGRRLFQSCPNLKDVWSMNTNPSNAVDAFDDVCNQAILHIPAGTSSKYQTAEGWNKFKNIVEEGNTPEPPQTSTYLAIEPFSIKAGEEKEMVISLTNPEDEITLVQFDLQLPDGLSIKETGGEYAIDIAGRTTWRKHSLDANATGGITRFLLASSSNATLSGTSGAVISITLVANDLYQSGDVKLEKILLVTPEEKEIKPQDVVFSVSTGIEMVNAVTKNNTVYTLSGQRLAAPKRGINIVGGKKVVVR